MKIDGLRIIAFIGTFFIATVHAAEEDSLLLLDDQDRNQNFNLSIGNTDFKEGDYHDQGALFKIHGGSRFGDFFALEAGFVYYAESTEVEGNIRLKSEGNGIEIQILGILPMTSWVELFGKVGVSKWRSTSKVEVINQGSVKLTTKGEDPIYGAGFLFNVDHDSTIRLEYEQYEFADTDIKAISLGFMHRY